MAMKVAWVTEIPTSYRSPLFSLLRQNEDLDLSVLYCAHSDPWRGGGSDPSDGEVLSGTGFGGRRGGPNWKVNLSVWRRLSEIRPNAVVVGGYAHPTMLLSALWCRRHQVPYILHSESQDLTPRPKWRSAIKTPLVSWAVRKASAYLPVSTPAADYLQGLGAPRDRMFLLPNSPDIHKIAEQVDRRSVRSGFGNPTFLFVGRLVEAKGPGVLLDAFSQLRMAFPGARLEIAGEGPLRAQLEERRQEGVSFHGHVTGAALIDLYGRAHAFVLPSYYEPYGVVVLEALAANLPVIVSDRVGSAEDLVVEGKTGYVFPSGDSAALADRMRRVIEGSRHGIFTSAPREMAFRWDYQFGEKSVLGAVHISTGMGA